MAGTLSFGSDFGSSLQDEAMALLLQNIINAQMPTPGYQEIGLGRPDDPRNQYYGPLENKNIPSWVTEGGGYGRLPVTNVAPTPAAPRPDLMNMLQAAQETKLRQQQAAALAAEESRKAQVFDPEMIKQMQGLQLEEAQGKQTLFESLMGAYQQATDPEEKLVLANMAQGRGLPNLFGQETGQRWSAFSQFWGPRAQALQAQIESDKQMILTKSGKEKDMIKDRIEANMKKLKNIDDAAKKMWKIDLPDEYEAGPPGAGGGGPLTRSPRDYTVSPFEGYTGQRPFGQLLDYIFHPGRVK